MVRRLNAYILFIKIKKKLQSKIGTLGLNEFPEGYYVYIGSGKKNLMDRIKRHLRMKKKKFWHIDYLLSNIDVAIIDIYITYLKEDEVVELMENQKGVIPFSEGFGSSDTENSTHLFRLKKESIITRIIDSVEKWI